MRKAIPPALSVVVALSALAVVSVHEARGDAAARQLRPGDVLNRETWQLAEGLLPPEILKHYRDGEYANPVVDWPSELYNWPPDFVEGTKQNEGRFLLGDRGQIIDRATGKQPPYVLGFPFPTIDPADPHAGAKVVWNYYYQYWYNGNFHVVSQINWVSPDRLDRRTDIEARSLFYDGLPDKERLTNPQNFLSQGMGVMRAPADLHGTASLTWRYRDPHKRDSSWAFVPLLRRARAVSPANRSDGFLGSDMSQDDGPFFAGKVEDFEWTLTGQVEHLGLVDPLSLEGRFHGTPLPRGGWRTEWPDREFVGYMDPDWSGVAWAPLSPALAKRRFWVVEGVPKDRYYLYGKIQLYIDAVTFDGSWNRKFSWTGELLNTMQVLTWNRVRRTRPDGTVEYLLAGNMAFQCAENVKTNEATVAGIRASLDANWDVRVPFDPSVFDVSSLSRFGK